MGTLKENMDCWILFLELKIVMVSSDCLAESVSSIVPGELCIDTSRVL